MTTKPTIEEFIKSMRAMYDARDWKQFHTPKNLAMNLGVEVGELMEHFRWATDEQAKNPPPEVLQEIKDEIADVFTCLLNLADNLGIDPITASVEKLDKVAKKYPVEKCKGQCHKHTHYTQ